MQKFRVFSTILGIKQLMTFTCMTILAGFVSATGISNNVLTSKALSVSKSFPNTAIDTILVNGSLALASGNDRSIYPKKRS